jgi:hypothetical protein
MNKLDPWVIKFLKWKIKKKFVAKQKARWQPIIKNSLFELTSVYCVRVMLKKDISALTLNWLKNANHEIL